MRGVKPQGKPDPLANAYDLDNPPERGVVVTDDGPIDINPELNERLRKAVLRRDTAAQRYRQLSMQNSHGLSTSAMIDNTLAYEAAKQEHSDASKALERLIQEALMENKPNASTDTPDRGLDSGGGYGGSDYGGGSSGGSSDSGSSSF